MSDQAAPSQPHFELSVKTEELQANGFNNSETVKSEDGSSPGSSSSPTSLTPNTNLIVNNPASRRPHRKSTLTQQQKNQKRQRATQDQLNTLEIEFNKNPTPNAAVRERIASDINMTERSVQIWFQNRRAKIKNIAKKSIETGEECNIPESMRQYLAHQAIENGNPFFSADMLGRGYAPGLMGLPADSAKVMIAHLTCRSLTIGSWRRIGQTQLDLVVFYSPTKSMVTYYIQAQDTGFRIEYPFSSIKSMWLDSQDSGANGEEGYINVELLQPPLFTMDQGSNGWFQCRDFTEDQQASTILRHRLGGNAKVLASQFGKLTSSDTYRNRFELLETPVPFGQQRPFAFPAVSPLEPRPSSQPNRIVHPHSGMFQEQAFAPNNQPSRSMGPPVTPHRTGGHKRQRSSSVPVAINFGPRASSNAPFTFNQHYHHHNHFHHPAPPVNPQQNQIFAPTPQYPSQNFQYPPQAAYGQIGPPLHVDPAAGFNFDFGSTSSVPPPLSATTGTTPPSSEFEHSLYPPPSLPDLYSAPPTQTTFNSTFLSPVMDSPHVHEQSASPTNNVDEQIVPASASLSPPAGLFRSHSADPRMSLGMDDQYFNSFKPINDDHFAFNGKFASGFEDSRFTFMDDMRWQTGNENVSALLLDNASTDHSMKQPLALPFRFSNSDRLQGAMPPATPPPQDDFEFSELVRLEPLTPEHERNAAPVQQ